MPNVWVVVNFYCRPHTRIKITSTVDNAEVFPVEDPKPKELKEEGQEMMEEKEDDKDITSIPTNQVYMAEVENITHEPFKTSDEIKVRKHI